MNSISKILLTGSTGLVGKAIGDFLFNKSFELTALNRKLDSSQEWEQILIDVESESIFDKISQQHFDAVIHCAAVIPSSLHNFDDCYIINSKIDLNVVNYVKKTGVRKLIYISSTNLYGIITDKVDEIKSVSSPVNAYSKNKLETEQLIFKLSQVEAFALRLNAVYSPLQKNNTVLRIFIENALNNKDLIFHGSGNRQQDFIHVNDVASVVYSCLMANNNTGIYNVSGGMPISMRDLALKILSKTTNSKSKLYASEKIDDQEAHTALIDISKAKEKLNWEPKISLDQGIEEWINHLSK